jgi:hypothetical protein
MTTLGPENGTLTVRTSIAYRSSAVTARRGGYDVDGELDLLGVSRPLALALQIDGEQLTGMAFSLDDGGGTIHTEARITGKAASMGEGVVASVLDALITDFTTKLAAI